MLVLPTSVLLLLLQIGSSSASSLPSSLADLASSLSSPISLPAPPTPMKSTAAVNFMQQSWSLWQNKIESGLQYFSFVQDPYGSAGSSPVLQIFYPKGSFGGDGGGGAHFYSTALSSQQNGRALGSVLVEYEVAFEEGFDWNLGGKLPGLRGGNPNGCGGGMTSDGLHCESTRLMWREGGAGEVYAYIPTTSGLCSSGITVECNDPYGKSLSRGTFHFPTGAWSKISLFVRLNSPATASNGVVRVYFNGELALSHEDLQIRASEKIFEGGLWFSSFFGGGNSTWASPKDQTSYFKNFKLSGSTEFSDDSSLPSRSPSPSKTPSTSTSTTTSFQTSKARILSSALATSITPTLTPLGALPFSSVSQASASSISQSSAGESRIRGGGIGLVVAAFVSSRLIFSSFRVFA